MLLPYYRPAYRPVTAYTITQPVKFDGVNRTNNPFPMLNYQPSGYRYPIVYAPLALLQDYGFEVAYDPQAGEFNVKSTELQTVKADLAHYITDVKRQQEFDVGYGETVIHFVDGNRVFFDNNPSLVYFPSNTSHLTWRYVNGSTVKVIDLMKGIKAVKDKYGVWYEFRTANPGYQMAD